MKRIVTIVDNARPLSPCHDAFVIHDRLVSRGHDASIVELRDPAVSGEVGNFATQSIPWPRRFSWSGFQLLRQSIQDRSPDEIHLWGEHSMLLVHALANLVRCPIRRIVGNDMCQGPSNGFWSLGRLLSRKIHTVSRTGDHGNGTLPWFGYSVDLSRDHRNSVRTRLGIPEHASLVGTVGPFSPRSGIKDFMWAGDLMRCIRDDVYWLVLGDGPQRWRLNRFSSQLEVSDRLRVLDYRDDIMEIVAALDVYVQPSTWSEDFSGLRAAISANVPAVGISNSVHKRLISHHRTGYLVERGARNEIARCVNRFITEPSIVEEFRANLPCWSDRVFCGVDQAVDQLLAGSESSKAQRAG